jgi:hypothetical protein
MADQFSSVQKDFETVFDFLRNGRFTFAFLIFERTESRQTNGGDKLRLVKRGLEAADGIGLA